MQHHQIYKTEDQLIAQLDRGFRRRRATDIAECRRIQHNDIWRERCRLAEFRRVSSVAREASIAI